MRAMKDSGIEWIGEIPESWDTKRNKQLFFEVNERCENGNEHTLLSVSEYYGIAPKSEKISDGDFETRAESLDGYKLCKVGDIVMNIMLAWKRSTGRSEYDGIVSPAYCVYRPIDNIDTKYYHYLFRTDIVANLFKQYSTGIIDSRLRLYPEKFLSLYMLVPPYAEQSLIAAYLDRQCALIDNITEKTKATIEEYKKLRQAVITQAVTKGVRGDRPMKDSGIEWIGEIPEEWNIGALRYFSERIGDGLHGTPVFDDNGDCFFVNGNNLGNKQIIYKPDTKTVADDEYEKNYIPLDSHTILISLNGTIGNVSYYNGEKITLGKSAGYIILNKTGELSKEYLYYYLQSSSTKTIFELSFAGTTINNLSLATMRGLPVCVCSMREQSEIAAYLDKKCTEIDSIIAKKEQFLTELETYKKSMIYEYVTGKKEVPQA